MSELPEPTSYLDQEFALRVKHIVQPLFRTLLKMTVNGIGNLPQQAPYVVAGTHSSNYDPFLIGANLPDDVELHFPAKKELSQIPFAARPLARAGAIFFDRHDHAAGQKMYLQATRIVHSGGVAIMFPEATRWHGESIRPQLVEGAALISRRQGVGISPWGIGGADNVLRSRIRPFPRRVHLEIGEPLEPTISSSRKSREAYNQELRQKLEQLKQIATEKAGGNYSKTKRKIKNKTISGES